MKRFIYAVKGAVLNRLQGVSKSAPYSAGDSTDNLVSDGNALQTQGRHEEALECYDRALATNPNNVMAICYRGVALQALGRYQEALETIDDGLTVEPRSYLLLAHRGNALNALNRRDDALASYGQALASSPNTAWILNNCGATLEELHRNNEALAHYAKAIAIQNDLARAHFNTSMCYLRMGDFERGWREYEWRWKTDDFLTTRRNFSAPLWLGNDDISSKTILLHAEQGFGDTIQFSRYVTEVAKTGATVLLEVQPQLNSLLANLPGVHQVLSYGEPLPAFDYHCPLMSLPLALGTRLNTIPGPISYLSAQSNKVRAWQEKLGYSERLSVGIVWSGRRKHRRDMERSIQLTKLMTLDMHGIRLISLQDAVRQEDVDELDAHGQLRHFGADLKDFSDTAALTSLMDVVITVDTSVAHLAGALGKPTWILLPAYADWRWLEVRKDSPWYPSACLFRQSQPREWGSVIERVRQALQNLIMAHTQLKN